MRSSRELTETTPGTGAAILTRRGSRLAINPMVAAYVVAMGLFFLGAIFEPGYLAPSHVVTVISLAAVLGIVAAGQTLVIISGGIDLSVGAVLTCAEVMTVVWASGSDGHWWALVAVLVVAVAVGFANALGIYAFNIQPLIMTLAMQGILTGGVLVITNANPAGLPPPTLARLMTGQIAGLPAGQLIVWLIIAAITMIVLHKTGFGRSIFAYGTNARTARIAGLRRLPMTIGVYVFSSVIAAVGGIVLAGYAQSGQFGVGDTYLMPSIAAVALGGTSILGGSGSYFGTIAGVIILSVIDDLVNLANIAAAAREVITGLTILLVLLAYGRQRRLRQ